MSENYNTAFKFTYLLFNGGGFETENKTEINARTTDRRADGRKTDMTKTNIAPAMKMAGN